MIKTISRTLMLIMVLTLFGSVYPPTYAEDIYVKEYQEIIVDGEPKQLIELDNGENLLVDKFTLENNITTFEIEGKESTLSFVNKDTSRLVSLIEKHNSDKRNQGFLLQLVVMSIMCWFLWGAIRLCLNPKVEPKNEKEFEIENKIKAKYVRNYLIVLGIFFVGIVWNYLGVVAPGYGKIIQEASNIYIEQNNGVLPIIDETVVYSGESNVLYKIDHQKLVEVDYRMGNYKPFSEYLIEKETGIVYFNQGGGNLEKIKP